MLRIMATLAVIIIHICTAETGTHSVAELGARSCVIYAACFTLVRWAVPVFIMITGGLLLNPAKELSGAKVTKYAARIAAVLLLFGTLYAGMELVFDNGLSQWYLILPKALLNTLQMKSWEHLWYLYLLIGLYILTPFTRAALSNLTESAIWRLIVILYAVTCAIPTINAITGLELTVFLTGANWYWLLYIVGYYLTLDGNNFAKHRTLLYASALASAVLMWAWDSASIVRLGEYSRWVKDENCLVPIVAVAVYVLVKSAVRDDKALGAFWHSVSECSFAVYLVHPFYINLIYKVFDITPRNFGLFLGVPLMFIVVFMISWATALMLRKIPILNKLL